MDQLKFYISRLQSWGELYLSLVRSLGFARSVTSFPLSNHWLGTWRRHLLDTILHFKAGLFYHLESITVTDPIPQTYFVNFSSRLHTFSRPEHSFASFFIIISSYLIPSFRQQSRGFRGRTKMPHVLKFQLDSQLDLLLNVCI